MIQQNEILTLVLGLSAVIFAALNRRRLPRLPGGRLFVASLLALFSGWTFTVLEGFAWSVGFNALEHACYAIGSLLLAWWSLVALPRRAGGAA